MNRGLVLGAVIVLLVALATLPACDQGSNTNRSRTESAPVVDAGGSAAGSGEPRDVSASDEAQRSAGANGSRRLSVGDMAPEFSLEGSDGRQYRLSDYRDKQVVVISWFARAFSAG